ncbi:hypothetical protein DMUE_4066 [Dictyocoela muelleri]|nr:hypothetical protein DMUE_4066 [Dictyocoela muelleri]
MNENVKARFFESLEPIGGEVVIVEIDESKFGKRKYHEGHRVEGVWVLGKVERFGDRRIILVNIENRNSETLTELIGKYIKPWSIIYSDCLRGYANISKFFTHLTVNHSLRFINKKNNVHTNTIEGNWSSLKKYITPNFRNIKKNLTPLCCFL